jgi:hypothetical protein
MKIRIPLRVESKNKVNGQRRDTEPGWIDASRRLSGWSLPEDPHERRRIRNGLIVLAAVMPIVQLIQWLFR